MLNQKQLLYNCLTLESLNYQSVLPDLLMPALKLDPMRSKAKESICDRNVKHVFRPVNSLDLAVVLFC